MIQSTDLNRAFEVLMSATELCAYSGFLAITLFYYIQKFILYLLYI